MGYYDRQELIPGIKRDMKVLVVGCGGIGFHVSKMLTMSGVNDIVVFDPDTLEESNLNRLDITLDFVGKNKADIVKQVCKSLRPEMNLKAFPFPLKDHTYPKDVDWVIDCTDNHQAQLDIERMANENGARYVKAGYDGTRMSLNDKVAQWDAGETQDGYRVTPSWCVPAIVIAALAVGKVMKYHDKEMGCDLSELY